MARNSKSPREKSHIHETSIHSDSQKVLDAIRKIVKTLRKSSKLTEKDLGLSAAQLFVLQKIAESETPLSINDLAVRTLTHQSSVSVVVAKLVKGKLVKRMASKLDARVVELHLSKKGAELSRRTPQPVQERLLSGISKLSPQIRRGLVIGLQSLIEKSGIQDEQPSLFFEDSDKPSHAHKRRAEPKGEQ